jgi:hypothetical protein
VAGGWKRLNNLHNEELQNLYASPNIIRAIKSRRMRWAGHVARMENMRCIQNLVGKPEGKRPRGRPRHRWENIRMDPREIGRKLWTGFIWLRIGTSGGHL